MSPEARSAMRPLSPTNRWLVAVFVGWLAGICIHAWRYVSAALAHPEQISDLYARSIGFQLVAFLYLNLLYWLLALAFALLIVQVGARRARSHT